MYLLSGRLNADGLFIENGERLNAEDIAIKLRIADRRKFSADFSALKKAGLIKENGHGPYIEAFSREQVDWSRKQEQDRERQAKHRNASVTRDENVTVKKSRAGHAPRPDQKKIKKEKKKEIKTTTPKPPTSKRRAPLGGGGGDVKTPVSAAEKNKESWMDQLTPSAKQTAQIIAPIMRSCGLGHSKIVTNLPKVATRINPSDAKRYALAALASVYADDDVSNKPVVAMYRMVNDQVPVQFTTSATWRVIPAEVLKVADVDPERLPRDEHSQARTASNHDVIRKVAANV